MSELATRQQGDLTHYDPEKAKVQDAKADAIIDYAKKVRDWPMLGAAINQKMADQAEFIRWWEENVRDRGRPKKK